MLWGVHKQKKSQKFRTLSFSFIASTNEGKYLLTIVHSCYYFRIIIFFIAIFFPAWIL